MTNELNHTENQVAALQSPIDYYPSKQHLKMMESITSMLKKPKKRFGIRPGFLARTDGFDVDGTIKELEKIVETRPEMAGLLSRLMSVSDLTDDLYDRFQANPNAMSNWYPEVFKALNNSPESCFKTPETNIMQLPIELAQFMRIEYSETSQKDRELFNQYIYKNLDLDEHQTYFIKTGTFSSKFQFANAKCSEPLEIGEYFQVINNFAMTVGAGQSIEIVVREYIEDVENNPTIYNGMPLRTEFRLFVDFDTNQVLGNVPYWHPIVMKRALKQGLSDSMEQDYQTYLAHEDKLLREFNQHHTHISNEIKALLPEINLNGQYSIDIMKNGDDFYIIDMALMSESALSELLPEYTYHN